MGLRHLLQDPSYSRYAARLGPSAYATVRRRQQPFLSKLGRYRHENLLVCHLYFDLGHDHHSVTLCHALLRNRLGTHSMQTTYDSIVLSNYRFSSCMYRTLRFVGFSTMGRHTRNH
jgi:hypothetical protein